MTIEELKENSRRAAYVGEVWTLRDHSTLIQILAQLEKDKKRLDFLESQTNGDPWVATQNESNTGYRLQNIPFIEAYDVYDQSASSVREAIDKAIESSKQKIDD